MRLPEDPNTIAEKLGVKRVEARYHAEIGNLRGALSKIQVDGNIALAEGAPNLMQGLSRSFNDSTCGYSASRKASPVSLAS